ncbi:tryptophan 7-halogenase [Paraglaciecola aquimarina]|uniref:Tryptophan 7-halogenase n=2 Tax=Paraglaciecola algarum TaxID=3050085 RepID=A0ABS9D1C9_9ALTE|nr:tryptophan 7-halogenase [Paraglaciecola sp. G1-23]
MVAAALSKSLGSQHISIRLVESEAIGTVGVGEATIPHIKYFNRLAGIDENEFLRNTSATFKLGIEFVNWRNIGDSYVHPFGPYGIDMQGVHFHHTWLRQKQKGTAKPVDEFSLPGLAAKAGKFQHPRPDLKSSPMATMDYAYQFDAALYGQLMRKVAQERGVKRTEGKIVKVKQNTENQNIESIELENGALISGDLFIDCSGFKGLLIEQTLKTGYEDWSHYLPCDRAVTRLSERLEELPPYTRATAKEAGWQWRIPLQSRTGNGYVYSSQFLSDDEALASLNKDLDTPAIAEAKLLRFKTGIRKKTWNKNVVAIGLAAGFLEPLESTSIHLIQSAIARLMTNWPDKSFNQPDIDYFNRKTQTEYEQVRDFLILHYCATKRNDSPFWDYCRTMDIPKSLEERIAIYKENARLYREDLELFSSVSWFAVFNGQNIEPKRYHPLADILDDEKLEIRMAELLRATKRCVEVMPSHEQYLKDLCASK